MLPIVEGCQAIIVNSNAGNDGKTVTVGKYIGYIDKWFGKNRWEIDIVVFSTQGNPVKSIDESQLMRIDGYKEEIKENADDVKVN